MRLSRPLITVFFLLFGLNSHSDNGQKIKNLSTNVNLRIQGFDSYHELSNPEKTELRRALRHVKVILDDLGVEDMSHLRFNKFVCIPKDHTDFIVPWSGPWVIAYDDTLATELTRVNNTEFKTKEACNQAASNIVEVGDANLMCGSKNNNGEYPFNIVITSWGSNDIVLKASVGASLKDCFQALKEIKVIPTRGAKICVSKDNDGQSPFIHAVYKTTTQSVEYGTQVFQTMPKCLQGL